jgi:hypothetical protein
MLYFGDPPTLFVTDSHPCTRNWSSPNPEFSWIALLVAARSMWLPNRCPRGMQRHKNFKPFTAFNVWGKPIIQ